MALNEAITKRAERIEQALSRLEEISKIPLAKFLNDWKSQDATLHNLQIAIEGCLDVGNYIISSIAKKSPTTYVEIIEILAEENVLPADFVETAKDMARFRNIVVHEYLYVNLEKVYSFLSKISDVHEFLRHLIKYLEKP